MSFCDLNGNCWFEDELPCPVPKQLPPYPWDLPNPGTSRSNSSPYLTVLYGTSIPQGRAFTCSGRYYIATGVIKGSCQ